MSILRKTGKFRMFLLLFSCIRNNFLVGKMEKERKFLEVPNAAIVIGMKIKIERVAEKIEMVIRTKIKTESGTGTGTGTGIGIGKGTEIETGKRKGIGREETDLETAIEIEEAENAVGVRILAIDVIDVEVLRIVEADQRLVGIVAVPTRTGIAEVIVDLEARVKKRDDRLQKRALHQKHDPPPRRAPKRIKLKQKKNPRYK